MRRRTLLAGVGVGGIASLSGCLGLIGMDEHESAPAGVEPETRQSTGYEQVGIEEVGVERDVGIGPLSSEMTVRNYVTEHDKSIEMPGPLGSRRGAVFVVITTPPVSLLGRDLNPVADMDAGELIDLVEANYDGLNDVERESESEIEVLGVATDQTLFTGTAEFSGQTVDVMVHVSEAVRGDDDLIVTLGVYPQVARSQEESNVLELMASVIEEADPDETDDPDDSNETDDPDGTDDGVTDPVGDAISGV